jgi:hypothetical protein
VLTFATRVAHAERLFRLGPMSAPTAVGEPVGIQRRRGGTEAEVSPVRTAKTAEFN